MTMKNIHTTPRSGMILMLMLAMMSLFAILIVGFMVVSSMANRQADSYQKRGRIQSHTSFAAAQEDTDSAVHTLLVGSTNRDSVIGPHSILENLYGHPVVVEVHPTIITQTVDVDWLRGTVATSTLPAPPAPFVRTGTTRFRIDNMAFPNPQDFWDQVSMIGNVLAFEDSANHWKTLRIVDVNIADIVAHVGEREVYVDVITESVMPAIGATIYINAAPYSGAGTASMGIDPLVPLDPPTGEDTDGVAYNLRPNPTAPSTGGGQDFLDDLHDVNNPNPVLLNPDYTAPDVANMFLAWYDDITPAVPPTTPAIHNSIPSFHRPSLFAGAADERKVSLRPIGNDPDNPTTDHPRFDGSNPAYDAEIGPWDVDNDRDGETDSVWVYTGMPARRSKDGKMYIPLVAYLVRDLDGRVNLNVAGNEAHFLNSATGLRGADPSWSSPPPPTFFDVVEDKLVGAITLPARGSGYGPAEIFLDKVLTVNSLDLLEGDASLGLLGRNVDVLTENILIGGAAVDSLQFWGYPAERLPPLTPPIVGLNYSRAGGIYGGRTPDFWGRDAIGFDVTGNRINFPQNWENLPSTGWDTTNVYTDNPYLFDPYHQTPYSQPFTLTEFETLLRPYDGDSLSLPQRLQHLFFGDIGGEPRPVDVDDVRNITVISSDIPSPNRRMRGEAGIYSLIYNCALAENGGIAATASTVTEDLMARLPEGIRQGLRIDLNQLVKSPNWSGGNHEDGLQARAQYAQGIYILLMAMCYDQLQGSYTEGPFTGTTGRELIKTRLAQWAVNIIDFADPDAVMTPMLFDMNPFVAKAKIPTNTPPGQCGWNEIADKRLYNLADWRDPTDNTTLRTPEYVITNNTGVRLVWGMERPDLVLTETMAFHNRRVADTSAASPPGHGTYTTESPQDDDFDQVGPPQGSAFFELYCTASPNQPYYPTELYDGNLLDLSKMDNDNSGDYSVWRIVIGESANGANTDNSIATRMSEAEFSFQPAQHREDGAGGALADPLRRSSVLGESAAVASHEIPIDRIVSFVPEPTSKINDHERIFWNTSSLPMELAPDSYLVIAPRTVTNLGSNIFSAGSVFGDPSNVGINLASGGPIDPANVMYCQDANGVELNISEPLKAADRTSYASAGSAAAPVDDLADDASGCPIGDDGLKGEGTVPFYKSAFLQRIADPRRDYDPVNNPYITVDWSMMDLTVFRGEEQGTSPEPGQTLNIAARPFHVSSRQWGKNALPVIPDRANPWARAINTTATAGGLTNSMPTNNGVGEALEFATFPYPPHHTLGKLNVFRVQGDTPSVVTDLWYPYTNTIQPHTTATLILGGLPLEYLGAPNFVTNTDAAGFLHLPWNNAPFANPLEVMQVPASAPGRFGVEFVDSGGATPPSLAEGNSMGTGGRFGADITGGRIGHLLNFFAVGDLGDPTAVPPVSPTSLNLGEFLEFLTVPSRFVGTQHYLDEGDATQSVSLYREPGKINLNTVPSAEVWDALKGDRAGPDYQRVLPTDPQGLDDARQGTGEFENPFRSASGHAASMLRIDTDKPVLEFGDTAAPNHLNRLNTYNELEGLQRLSSMTTNRSNVFAVWVTVGYFEAEKVTWDVDPDVSEVPVHITSQAMFNAIYPQGYMIGAELGYESGEVVRHRAFYIIDRTIPVGFRRGKLMNAEDTILLKRVLE